MRDLINRGAMKGPRISPPAMAFTPPAAHRVPVKCWCQPAERRMASLRC